MENTIFLLRKELKLSQEKFGKKLGVGKAAISKLENNERGLTDTMAKLICSTFNVNEEWLKTGAGEMFIKPDDEFGAAIGDLIDTDDEFIKNMFIGIAKMSPGEREILKKAIDIIKKSNIF